MCSECVFSWLGCYCSRFGFVLIEHVLANLFTVFSYFILIYYYKIVGLQVKPCRSTLSKRLISVCKYCQGKTLSFGRDRP